jgi:hypothetical protein
LFDRIDVPGRNTHPTNRSRRPGPPSRPATGEARATRSLPR